MSVKLPLATLLEPGGLAKALKVKEKDLPAMQAKLAQARTFLVCSSLRCWSACCTNGTAAQRHCVLSTCVRRHTSRNFVLSQCWQHHQC